MLPVDTSGASRRAFWLAAAALAIAIELVAVVSGGDASWDLRSHHLCNPFALLEKPFGTDIAPAHLQTFFPPTPDLFYASLARSVPYTFLLSTLLALPQGIALEDKVGFTLI